MVSGGRGTGGNFEPIEGLADALGAAVGASRAAVDSGWMPHSFQVGQTGKVVSPQLYVANGISVRSSTAPACRPRRPSSPSTRTRRRRCSSCVDFGVVGDLHAVLPAATEQINQRKG